MAYKFQLGEAKLSGSITQTDGSGDLRATTVDSLNVSNGGISAAGAIAGATTIAGSGLASLGSLVVDDGSTIGCDSDGNLLTLNSNILTVAGEVSMTTLDIGGTNVTSTAAELNLVDGSSAGSIVNSKAVIYGAGGQVNATSVSASTFVSASLLDIESNAQIGGNIDSAGDLTVATITMSGFSVDADGDTALKSLAVDDSSTIGCDSDTDLLTLSGQSVVMASDSSLTYKGTAVLSTGAELNLVDGSIANTVVNNKAVIYGAAGQVRIGSLIGSLGNTLITSGGNLEINDIEFDGNIDIANAGNFSLGASMGANTMTLGGASSTVRIAGDLEVVGTLERVTETELLIEDKVVIVASGSANAAAAAGAGLKVDIASGDMTFLYQANGENVGGVDASSSGDIFVASGSAGLIDIQAAAFFGDGSNLTNVNAVGLSETVQSISSAGTINMANGLQILVDVSAGPFTLTLPAPGAVEGKILKIKKKNNSSNVLTLNTSAGNIDGAGSIRLESGFAAVNIISDGSNFFVI